MTSLVTGGEEVQTSKRLIAIREDTLQQIAKGLCEYEQQIPKKSLSNYPAALELGVNKLTVACLTAGVPQQIQGVPNFISTWARISIKDWDIEIECHEEWREQKLIENQKPSGFCIEVAGEYFDECGNFQQQVINEVMLKAAQKPELYTNFRCYIIEHPVITKGNLDVDSYLRFKPVQDLLKNSYEKAPDYKKDGQFYCCGHCGGLMYLAKNDKLNCENKHCAKYKKAPVPFPADEDDEVLWLKKDLRYFIHRPGKVELRLCESLKHPHLELKLYPELDKYDLHLVFPDRTVWAVDVKFWESAYNLAKKVDKPIPRLKSQPYDESFFVFPDEIQTYGQEYLQEFRSYCTVPLKKSQVMFEAEFVKKVIKKLENNK